ncbi:pentatricopeptide repeat-containing protein [Iris pallida]|uniref:Pentatricopeptide repeat-containing protein n=1 Tax=Iris pallida TaxID=29817 RepID=A0AAX6DRP3_IRIPA|nr:pentatricopeptide repeat-containing protein [Iris pallida]
MNLTPKLLPRTLIPTTLPPKPLNSLLPPSLDPHLTTITHLTSFLKTHPTPTPTPTPLPLPSHLLPYLTPDTLSTVLLLSQSNPLPSLSLLLHPHLPFPPSPQNLSIVSHSLSFSRHHRESLLLLSAFLRSHPHVDALSSLLSAARLCNWTPAVFDLLIKAHPDPSETLRRVLRLGLFVPSVHSFNHVLKNKSEALGSCWQIYADMRRLGVSPNAHTFNILVGALCRAGDERRAVEFLEEVESEGFDPDVVTYNTLIGAYSRRGRLDNAMALYKVMYRRGVEPDLITYTLLVKGFCKEGRMGDARRVFDRMLERGLRPDTFCFGVIIVGYCKVGMLGDAVSLVGDMFRYGLKPDKFTCSSLVEGYVKVGRLLPCLNMIEDLRRHGVVVNFDDYKSILDALSSERRPNAMRSLVDWMVRDGYEPGLEIYDSMIGCFCDCGSTEQALVVKEEMVGRDIRPGVETYRLIITSLCNIGRVMEGERLMMEMVGSGLVADSDICAALVGGYCRQRYLSKIESVLSYFALECQIYDNKGYNTLMKMYCEEGDMAASLDLQNRMMKLGFVSDGQTCKSLIYGLTRTCNLYV